MELTYALLFILGLATAVSPCSAPFLFLTFPVLIRRYVSRHKLALCPAVVFLMIFSIGLIAVAIGYVVELLMISRYILALILSLIGVLIVLGKRPKFIALKPMSGRGVLAFCAGYAILSSHCNLPLIIGASIYIALGEEVLDRLIRLIIYALGTSVPIVIALALGSYIGSRSIVKRALTSSKVLEYIAGIALIIAAIAIVMY